MKYLSPILVFLVGAILSAVGFVVLFPPSTVDLGIEIGRKIGLVAAEARYAKYETGHAVLLTKVEEAEKRTAASESSLKAFRASSVKEVKRLKKIEQDAFFDQREASQEQPALQDTENSSWETLESVTSSSEPVTQEAVTDAKVASRALYNNCMVQLRAANEEVGSLRLQLDLKSRELVVVWKSRNAWQDRAEAEELLRKDAEAYIKDVKDSGFYFGVGATGGYSKLLSGASGPGGTIGFSTGWRF